jgi:peptidoglycan/xylan/chitin deacetylase (PgdA/CDA1 family)
MIGLALGIALKMTAQHVVASGFPGVSLSQELRAINWNGRDLKVISRTYEPRTIALTFDDGPHGAKTLALLKVLKDLDVKATFFLVGKMVDRNPTMARLEVALGHEVGNHTYHHFNLDRLRDHQIAREYIGCSNSIWRATGQRPIFCRPPGGRFDTDVVEIAAKQRMWTVLWTDHPGDFARPDPNVLVERVDRQMRGGGILLLHDGIPQTVEVLPELVRELRKRGYRFVTCSELVAQQARHDAAVAQKKPDGNHAALAIHRKSLAGPAHRRG